MQKIYLVNFLFILLSFTLNAQTSVNDFSLENLLEYPEETNHSSKEINVFPSIITDNFQVTLNQKHSQATVQLYSLDGEKLLEQDVSKTTSNITVYGLEDDIYMVNVLDLQGEVIHSEWIVVEK